MSRVRPCAPGRPGVHGSSKIALSRTPEHFAGDLRHGGVGGGSESRDAWERTAWCLGCGVIGRLLPSRSVCGDVPALWHSSAASTRSVHVDLVIDQPKNESRCGPAGAHRAWCRGCGGG